MAPSPEAVRLARRLRELRESQRLTQSDLARALSTDSRVAVATISSWESQSSPKLPPEERLRAYALLFSTTLTDDTSPRVRREHELTADERERFQTLHRELLGLRDCVRHQVDPLIDAQYTLDFESGPVTVICPELPAEIRSPLAEQDNANHTRLYRYADLDALIELWGHLRASNPELPVQHRLPTEINADDLSGHLILLGGIAFNSLTGRLMRVLDELPIRQVAAPDLNDGEIFRSRDGAEYRPLWDASGDSQPRELVEDVALLVRLRNPFNHSRTITICNGVYSRGVVGAVRTLTDAAVREQNEAYLAHRFPGGSYALLLRVPVVNGTAMTPDLEIPQNRLFEWCPEEPDG
ncbi:helix-turn-helix domain-containing protein [Kribbella sp. NPDC049227]|uniref:helix-turn-helix domain-containing protein n=1 Tax=Kribbella sp. NPDC049227 TaxID=3364113 RepID=UPI00371133B2